MKAVTSNAAPRASDDGEPAFAAPWEANAFALKAALVERGLLSAERFAVLLGEELRRGHVAADFGTAYFVAFVAALERALETIADAAEIEAERNAWHAAAEATPHGEPIVLPARSAR